jgi:molybdenum cofactor biosynthesis enzyme MoaA
MKIETLSVLVGGTACNASCPFCVSKMTVKQGMSLASQEINIPRLRKTIQFAERSGVSTVLLTGKGEPTLFPSQLLQYLSEVGNHFPFVELQTNGIALAEGSIPLRMLPPRGLTTVCLSLVHFKPEVNQRIYYSHRPEKEYFDLCKLIDDLHMAGITIRMSVMMMKGGIESIDDVRELITFAVSNGVEQVSIRSVTVPRLYEDEQIFKWTSQNKLSIEELTTISNFLHKEGTLLLELRHGSKVFDIHGQNICLTDCLTPPKGEEIRQIIFFPDGHVRYDWQYAGAILM